MNKGVSIAIEVAVGEEIEGGHGEIVIGIERVGEEGGEFRLT